MTTHFTFSVDKSTVFDTLEAVLAIARRGCLGLASMHVSASASVGHVTIELMASEPELLDLFGARLRNLVDVFDIHDRSGSAVGPLYTYAVEFADETVSS